MSTALVVAAHDDDVRHIAGTVARFNADGHRVVYLVLTRGEMGTNGSPEIREKELAACCRVLGCEYRILGAPLFRDTAVANNRETQLAMIEQLRSYRPGVIFAPWPETATVEIQGMVHPDHAAAGALVRDAVMKSRFSKIVTESQALRLDSLYYYMLPWNVPGTIVFDVTEQINRAMSAVGEFASQCGGDPQAIERLLRAQRTAVGGRDRFCEAFVPARRLRFRPEHFFQM